MKRSPARIADKEQKTSCFQRKQDVFYSVGQGFACKFRLAEKVYTAVARQKHTAVPQNRSHSLSTDTSDAGPSKITRPPRRAST